MKRTLIIAAVLLSTVVFALPAIAGPVESYINGQWFEIQVRIRQVHGLTDAQAGVVSRAPVEIRLILDNPAWIIQ